MVLLGWNIWLMIFSCYNVLSAQDCRSVGTPFRARVYWHGLAVNKESPAQAGSAAVTRADDLLNRAAHRIGCVASRTRQRLPAAANAIHTEADRLDLPQAAPAQKERPLSTAAAPVEQPGLAATHTAEAMVDAFGHRLGVLWLRPVSNCKKLGLACARRLRISGQRPEAPATEVVALHRSMQRLLASKKKLD